MARICIFGGLGRIGTALTQFLTCIGHTVDICDVAYEEKLRVLHANKVFSAEPEDITEKAGYDIFVSCAPTSLNERIRARANELKIKYTDFGGDADHQDVVRDDFLNCDHGVLTGIGLAPGYINLIISEACKFIGGKGYKPKRVFMYVGGIASDRYANVLSWIPTWSSAGLIQSYKGMCRFIKDGNIVEEIACQHHAYIPMDFAGTVYTFEAFTNSGGMSHTLYEMLDLGAEDCYYYTLRWPGHLNVAKTMFMMGDKFGISEEEVIKYITEITANTGTDIVLGKAVVEYDSNRGDGTMLRDICSIVYHAEQGFSAMQLATAIPAAAMIDYMLAYDLKGYLTYNDLDYKEIENTVASIRSKIGLMAETGGTIIDAHDKYEEGTDDAV